MAWNPIGDLTGPPGADGADGSDADVTALLGQPNGIATLDAAGRLPSAEKPILPSGHGTGSGNAGTWSTNAALGTNIVTLTATGAGTHQILLPSNGVAGQVIRFRMLASVSGVNLTFHTDFRTSTDLDRGPYAIPNGEYGIFAIEALTATDWSLTAITITDS